MLEFCVVLVPEGVPSPTLIPQSSTSILIIWGPVQSPNGAITQYNLERRFFNQTKSVLIRTFLPSDALQYVDNSIDIVPYSGYEYRVAAATVAGFGYGPWAAVFTKSASKEMKLLQLFWVAIVTVTTILKKKCYSNGKLSF